MEDYLETIADLLREKGQARVSDIAERLSVSKPGVTQALRTLTAKKLINYRPYVSPTLTPAGKAVADRVQYRHDMLKRFMQDVLLIEADRAEENACRIEHAVDRDVLEHIARFTDFVGRCPRAGARMVRGYDYFCHPEKDGGTCQACIDAGLDKCPNEE
jgi:DtxR family Mn-dependent transcriptional regulator